MTTYYSAKINLCKGDLLKMSANKKPELTIKTNLQNVMLSVGCLLAVISGILYSWFDVHEQSQRSPGNQLIYITAIGRCLQLLMRTFNTGPQTTEIFEGGMIVAYCFT